MVDLKTHCPYSHWAMGNSYLLDHTHESYISAGGGFPGGGYYLPNATNPTVIGTLRGILISP